MPTDQPLTVTGWAVKLDGKVLLDSLRNSHYAVEKLVRGKTYPISMLVEIVPVEIREIREGNDVPNK